MPEVIRNGQGFSTAFPKPGDIIIKPDNKIPVGGSKKGGKGGGASLPQSSISNPTPSASELYGTPSQKEQQLAAFKSGGRSAFESAKAKQIQEDKVKQEEALRKATEQARKEKQQQIERQRISGQVQGSQPVDLYQNPFPNQQASFEPVVFQKQTGTAIDPTTGKTIPVYENRYAEPPFEGGLALFGGTIDKSVPASKEQIEESKIREGKVEAAKVDLFETTLGKVGLAKEARSIRSQVSTAKTKYVQAEQRAKEQITEPLIKKSGFSEEKFERNLLDASQGNLLDKSTAFFGGVGYGVYKQVKERPLGTIATAGVGVGAGLTKNALITGASKIKPIAGSLTRAGITTAEIGMGGAYGYSVLDRAVTSKSPGEAGQVVGGAVVEAGAFGIGYAKGFKFGEQLKGWYSTRGRTEKEFELLTTPEIISGKETFLLYPKSKQVQAFKEGTYSKNLGLNEPAAFHTTPQRFPTNEPFIPNYGTSEIGGAYGSIGISPAFSKIPGSGSNKRLPTLKDLFTPGSKPGVEVLQPEGFREVSYGFKQQPLFEGQKRVSGGYAYIKQSPRQGYADIPLMKTEAEAIFRPESFPEGFNIVSKQYYTRIKGVRVPIDIFKYERTGKIEPVKPGENPLTRRGYRTKEPEILSSRARNPYSKVFSGSSNIRSQLSGASYLKSKSSFLSTSSAISSIGSGSSYPFSSSSYSSYFGSSSAFSSGSSSSTSSGGGSSLISSSSFPGILKLGRKEFVRRSKRLPQILKQPTRYQPSFTASALDIEAPSPPKILGLSVRPIIRKRKKKKKLI